MSKTHFGSLSVTKDLDVRDQISKSSKIYQPVIEGTAAPTATPDGVGQIFIDTTADKSYTAVDTSGTPSTDWKEIGAGSSWIVATTKHVYISSAGSDSIGTGSPNSPYKTIVAALASHGSNTTYFVADAITEVSTISIVAGIDNIAIVGFGPEVSKIQNSTANVTLQIISTGVMQNISVLNISVENTIDLSSSTSTIIRTDGVSADLSGLRIHNVKFLARGGSTGILSINKNNSAANWDFSNSIDNIQIEWSPLAPSSPADSIGLDLTDIEPNANPITVGNVTINNLGWGDAHSVAITGAKGNNNALKERVYLRHLTCRAKPITTGNVKVVDGVGANSQLFIDGSSIFVDGGNDKLGDVEGILFANCKNCYVEIYREYDSAANLSAMRGIRPIGNSTGNSALVTCQTTGTFTYNKDIIGMLLTGANNRFGSNEGEISIGVDSSQTITIDNDVSTGGVFCISSSGAYAEEVRGTFSSYNTTGFGGTVVNGHGVGILGDGSGSFWIGNLVAALRVSTTLSHTQTTSCALALYKGLLGSTIVLGKGSLIYIPGFTAASYTGGAILRRLLTGGSGNPVLETAIDATHRTRFTLDTDGNITVSRTDSDVI